MNSASKQPVIFVIMLILCICVLTVLYLTSEAPDGIMSPRHIKLKDYLKFALGNKVYMNLQLSLYGFVLSSMAIALSTGTVTAYCTRDLKRPIDSIPVWLLGGLVLYLFHVLVMADKLFVHFSSNAYLAAVRAFLAAGFYLCLVAARRVKFRLVKEAIKYTGIIALAFVSMYKGFSYVYAQGLKGTPAADHPSFSHAVSILDINPLTGFSPAVNQFNALMLLGFSFLICLIYWYLERAALNALQQTQGHMQSPRPRSLRLFSRRAGREVSQGL